MAKHFRAWARAGYTFGMEVDATLANRMLKKVETVTITHPVLETTQRIRVLAAKWVKTMMGAGNGWQIDERHFGMFEVEDSGQIYIEYEDGIYFWYGGKLCPTSNTITKGGMI